MLLSSCQSALLLLASICILLLLLLLMVYFDCLVLVSNDHPDIASATVVAISGRRALVVMLKAACRTGPVRKLKHWFGTRVLDCCTFDYFCGFLFTHILLYDL